MIIQIPKQDSIIFDYIPHNNKLKPMANIKFQYAENKEIFFPALIDSGADKSCSFKSIGKKLGIDFTDYDKQRDIAFGLNGKGVPGYIAPLSFWIGKNCITAEIVWLDIKFDPQRHYFFLLGREVIFEQFDIVFQEHQKRIIFRKV